jgi:hypothetical protein
MVISIFVTCCTGKSAGFSQAASGREFAMRRDRRDRVPDR